MSTTIIEEIRVTGAELIDKVKEIIREGNVRRISIINDDGDVLLDLPLTLGVAGFGVSLFAMGPVLTAIGLFALFMNDYNIVVEREKKTDKNEVEAQVIDIENDEDEEDNDDEEENG